MPRSFIVAIAAAALFGCFIAHFITGDTLVYIAAAIIGMVAALVVLRKKEKAVLICVCGIITLIGMLRMLLPLQHQDAPLTERYVGQVLVEGVITGDIEDKDTTSRYTITVHRINGATEEKKKKILVYEPYPTKCVSGEAVSFTTTLQQPEDFLTETGRIFPYRSYLKQMGIEATARRKDGGCTGKREQHAFFARMRAHFMQAMHTFLPAEEATLLGGLLLGLRGALPAGLLEAFRMTGLIHIIVLSGHNITMIAEVVRRVLKKVPTSVSFSVSLVVIVMFVLFAGAQMAAIRAGSMATIALIARATHREYDGIRALSIVAVTLVLFNPTQVLFSISFHLSFLATLGLLLFAPSIERKIEKVPEKFGIRGIVAATIATQILLLPYLAYAIGEISTIGIPANILVLPIIPFAMFFGAAITLIALIVPFLAIALSPIAYLPLKAITTITETMAKIPHATMPLPEIGPIVTALITAAIIYIGYRQTQKTDNTQIKEAPTASPETEPKQ